MNKKILRETSNKLHHIAALYISGEVNSLSETLDPKNKVFIELVKTCKLLKESLEDQNIENISVYIDKKNQLSKKFYDLTCIRWRL
jgi:hypothetical protein